MHWIAVPGERVLKGAMEVSKYHLILITRNPSLLKNVRGPEEEVSGERSPVIGKLLLRILLKSCYVQNNKPERQLVAHGY
jgi:hypothetical protein